VRAVSEAPAAEAAGPTIGTTTLWAAAAAGGVLLGSASLLPYFGTAGAAHVLGNSAAIWLACAYAIGTRSGGYLRGAAAGTSLLLVTLTAFYAGTYLLYPAHSSLASDVAYGDTLWLIPAVCGGSSFGALGWLRHSQRPVLQAMASSALGAAFLAESALYGDAAARSGSKADVAVSVAEAAFGICLALMLARGRPARRAVLWMLPLLAGAAFLALFLAFHLVGGLASRLTSV
jgi:hypothetical protein